MPTADARSLVVAGAIALAVAIPARADIAGTVVAVIDGDTISILDMANARHAVRLAGIDAPERGQPGGFRAKESLARLVLDREVRVETWTSDRDRNNGVVVGQVRVAPPDCPTCGPTLDVGLAQIAMGRAWSIPDPAGRLSATDRARYASAEQEARARRVGLWRERAPIPPWQWRERQHRSGS